MFSSFAAGIELAKMALPVLERWFPDPAERAKAQTELAQVVAESDASRLQALKDIIVAETQAGGLNALWRPVLAFFYIFLMSWSWMLVPVINTAFGCLIWTPDAGVIGSVGGLFLTVYGIGRTLEKGIEIKT